MNESPQIKNPINQTMKTLLALALVTLTAAASAQAEGVRGHFRSNGTYVLPYYRTAANGTPFDNLSNRGYPSQQPGYVSPRSSGLDSGGSRTTPLPGYGNYRLETMPRTYTDSYSSTPLYRRANSFGF